MLRAHHGVARVPGEHARKLESYVRGGRVNKLFSPIVEAVFEGSRVQSVWGETGCDASVKVVQLMKHFSEDTRGTLKVDLRLVYEEFDVADAEFSKTGDVEKKNTTDAMKVAAEGKCIFDAIVRRCGLDFVEAKNLKIANLQVCGLKGVLVMTQMVAPGVYVVTKFKSLHFPAARSKVEDFFKTGLPILFQMRDLAEENASLLRSRNKTDKSNFGTRSPTPETPFLRGTWLGPGPASRRKCWHCHPLSWIPPPTHTKFFLLYVVTLILLALRTHTGEEPRRPRR